jgi:hypothetical protein
MVEYNRIEVLARKPKMLIICTVNGKRFSKGKITYISKLLRINAVV